MMFRTEENIDDETMNAKSEACDYASWSNSRNDNFEECDRCAGGVGGEATDIGSFCVYSLADAPQKEKIGCDY